jgi:molybdopterin-binding protein
MIELKKLNIEMGEFKITDLNLSIKSGEYFVILGMSGAGKSILLEALTGIHLPTSGRIIVDQKDITKNRMQERPFGMVFQDFALFPHKTVYENISYALPFTTPKKIKKDQVHYWAKEMEITHLLDRYPRTLSGGEKQRTALARTLIIKPKYLLLDEPLSSLDIQLKEDLRAILRRLHRNGQSIIHITHDYNEAIALADRIAVFENGKVIQEGTPVDVFSNPSSKFIARFGGIKNFFQAKAIDNHKVLTEETIEFTTSDTQLHSGANYYMMFNDTDVSLSSAMNENSIVNQMQGRVHDIIPEQSAYEVKIETKGLIISSKISHQSIEKLNIKIGQNLWFSVKATSIKLIPIKK